MTAQGWPSCSCRPGWWHGRAGGMARLSGCPHAPATCQTADTTGGSCCSSPAATKASRAVPEGTAAWLSPGTPEVLVGSAGRQQCSPSHQRRGACHYQSRPVPWLPPGRTSWWLPFDPGRHRPPASWPSALLGKESPAMCPSPSTRKVVRLQKPCRSHDFKSGR